MHIQIKNKTTNSSSLFICLLGNNENDETTTTLHYYNHGQNSLRQIQNWSPSPFFSAGDVSRKVLGVYNMDWGGNGGERMPEKSKYRKKWNCPIIYVHDCTTIITSLAVSTAQHVFQYYACCNNLFNVLLWLLSKDQVWVGCCSNLAVWFVSRSFLAFLVTFSLFWGILQGFSCWGFRIQSHQMS